MPPGRIIPPKGCFPLGGKFRLVETALMENCLNALERIRPEILTFQGILTVR